MLAALLAATLLWSPYDAALARAKNEQKLVLVHLRATSDRANVEPDAKLERAVANENIALMLDSFVLARSEGRLPGIDVSAPALVVLDPDGRLVLPIKIGSEQLIGSTLGGVRERSIEILRSTNTRHTHGDAAADVLLGREIVMLSDEMRGAALLRKAAVSLRASGMIHMAIFADLWVGIAQYSVGMRPAGRMAVIGVLKNRETPPAIAAEALCVLGDMAIAEKRREEGIRYYRQAYEIAPPGTPALRRARRELETYDTRPLPPKETTSAAVVRLIMPARRSLTGPVNVVVEADPRVASTELYLDGVRVDSDEERPFQMTADVGPAAMMRTLKAVGYDDSGQAIGEDVLTINDRIDAFRVAITAPSEQIVHGAANIEADVHVPETRKVQRLDFYWKERLLTTLHAPPFRYSFQFPAEFGYVRVVGTLDDGTTAEDARILNGEGMSATVDVRAVTLYATVTDANGNRVEGLAAEDFVVEDEGTVLPVNVIRATDTPVTIGLAIDSSSSMGQWLFQAQQLATGFAKSGEGSDDRTFVTSFDTAPRLVHEASSDIASLRTKILGITIGGGTSIFDGVIFALQQFQDVPGRKALVVISDGREGASSSSSSEAIRTARAAAVPIYSLAPVSAPALRSLADATGGIAFQTTRTSEQPAVFDKIRNDVRGQYLITFQPRTGKAGTWRSLQVRTRRDDLKVRTVSGYYAR